MKGNSIIPYGRGIGKSEAIRQKMNEHIKKNPNAVIVTFRNGEMIVEKPVKQVETKLLNKPE